MELILAADQCRLALSSGRIGGLVAACLTAAAALPALLRNIAHDRREFVQSAPRSGRR